jgi:hypothetical protein
MSTKLNFLCRIINIFILFFSVTTTIFNINIYINIYIDIHQPNGQLTQANSKKISPKSASVGPRAKFSSSVINTNGSVISINPDRAGFIISTTAMSNAAILPPNVATTSERKYGGIQDSDMPPPPPRLPIITKTESIILTFPSINVNDGARLLHLLSNTAAEATKVASAISASHVTEHLDNTLSIAGKDDFLNTSSSTNENMSDAHDNPVLAAKESQRLRSNSLVSRECNVTLTKDKMTPVDTMSHRMVHRIVGCDQPLWVGCGVWLRVKESLQEIKLKQQAGQHWLVKRYTMMIAEEVHDDDQCNINTEMRQELSWNCETIIECNEEGLAANP